MTMRPTASAACAPGRVTMSSMYRVVLPRPWAEPLAGVVVVAIGVLLACGWCRVVLSCTSVLFGLVRQTGPRSRLSRHGAPGPPRAARARGLADNDGGRDVATTARGLTPMALPSPSYTITMRVQVPASQAATSELVAAAAAQGASVTGVDIAQSSTDHLTVDLTCDTIDGPHSQRVVDALDALEDVHVLKVS